MNRKRIAGMTHQEKKTQLDYGVNGDKFYVCYYDPEDELCDEREFDTAAAAAQVYLKIAGWILLGAYTDEQRIEYLMTGTMK